MLDGFHDFMWKFCPVLRLSWETFCSNWNSTSAFSLVVFFWIIIYQVTKSINASIVLCRSNCWSLVMLVAKQNKFQSRSYLWGWVPNEKHFEWGDFLSGTFHKLISLKFTIYQTDFLNCWNINFLPKNWTWTKKIVKFEPLLHISVIWTNKWTDGLR